MGPGSASRLENPPQLTGPPVRSTAIPHLARWIGPALVPCTVFRAPPFGPPLLFPLLFPSDPAKIRLGLLSKGLGPPWGPASPLFCSRWLHRDPPWPRKPAPGRPETGRPPGPRTGPLPKQNGAAARTEGPGKNIPGPPEFFYHVPKKKRPGQMPAPRPLPFFFLPPRRFLRESAVVGAARVALGPWAQR